MEINILGNISLYDMMIYFFVYSFLGWCAEVVFSTLKTGKFINRGFLNGPVCPIYGVGMAVCVLLLNTLTEHWYLLFAVGVLFATLLELVTGFVLERVFNTKWWDYSKEPFNFKGYICLRFSILWGLTILLMFKTLVPLTEKLIDLIPFEYTGMIILIVFWLTFICDLIATIIQLKRLKENIKQLTFIGEKLHESSDRIGTKIFETTKNISERFILINEKIKNSRLGKAFPNVQNKTEEIKRSIQEKIDQLKKK